MTDDIQTLVEQNAKNIHTLADALDVNVTLDDDFSPETAAQERAKFFGFETSESASAKQADLDDDERTAALMLKNAENLQRLLKAADVRESRIAGTSSASKQKAKFLALD